MGILEDVYSAVIDGKVDDAAAGVEQGLNELRLAIRVDVDLCVLFGGIGV